MNQHLDDVRLANSQAAESAQDRFSNDELSTNRRDLLMLGRRLIYVVPIVQFLSASSALAGSVASGAASCAPALEFCVTDADCCSADCDLGVCQ